MLAGFADEHVHEGIVVGLRRRGMDVVTVQDLGLEGTDDEDLLLIATRETRLMLTSDKDFLRIHTKWLRAAKDHTGIAYWPGGGVGVGYVIRRVEEYAKTTTPAEARNALEYI